MIKVRFFTEDVSFSLKQKRKKAAFLSGIFVKEKSNITSGSVCCVLCSDSYLLTLNRTFARHNTLTDILTFEDYDKNGFLTSDIFISIERVKENAFELNVPFSEELLRVMIHGVLHICGYSDHTLEEKKKMRKTENLYIQDFANFVSRET